MPIDYTPLGDRRTNIHHRTSQPRRGDTPKSVCEGEGITLSDVRLNPTQDPYNRRQENKHF